MTDSTEWQDKVTRAEKRERLHANDANYFRHACSMLMTAGIKGMGEERLLKILDEMHASDLINTVDVQGAVR